MISNVVRGNTVDTSTNGGIVLIAPGGTDYTLTDCIIEGNLVTNVNTDTTDNGAPAISIYDGTTSGGRIKNIAITGNVIKTTGKGYGIRAWGAKGVTVSGNSISDTADMGIYVGPVGAHRASDITVTGNTVQRYKGKGIYVFNSDGVVVSGNAVRESTDTRAYMSIAIDCATNYAINANSIIGDITNAYGLYITNAAQYGVISNNTLKNCKNAIYYDATGGKLNIVGNDLSNGNIYAIHFGGTLTDVVARNNLGFNPVGALTYHGGNPVMPNSDVALRNNQGYDCLVTISGGVVTAIALGKDPEMGNTGLTSGTFRIPAGSHIKISYTSAPDWTWFGM